MKKIIGAIVILMVISSCATTGTTMVATNADPDTAPEAVEVSSDWTELAERTGNLLETLPAESWFPLTDEYGSSYVVTDPLIVDGVIDASFTIVKKVGNEWPWVELDVEFENNIAGTQGIEIEYASDYPLILKFTQSDFTDEGDNSYAHYEYKLPASMDPVTAFVSVDDFAQPGWATDASKSIPLKLENVQQMGLVPGVNYMVGETAQLTLTHFELYGINL